MLRCAVLQAYHEEYNGSVMFVEEFRPSDLFTADTGGQPLFFLESVQGAPALVRLARQQM